jgi:hypothetical protein
MSASRKIQTAQQTRAFAMLRSCGATFETPIRATSDLRRHLIGLVK